MRKWWQSAPWATNRQRAAEPRGRAWYCVCDRAHVAGRGKCPVCHRRPGKPRAAKPSLLR